MAVARTTAPTDTAIIYRRVSTAEQAASGAGLDAQFATTKAEATRRGWTIIDTYTDEGLSGSLDVDARPGLAAAVNAIESGKASILLVAKSDRLARSLHALTGLMLRADKAGWSLAAADGSIDTSTPAGRFQTQIMGGVAELERAMISQRTKDALAAKKAAGVRLGRPSALSRDVVARIVAAKAAGKSLRAIANALTEEQVPTAQGGKKWHASTVKAVLEGQDARVMGVAAR